MQIEELIEAAEWRKTTYIQAHEYVVVAEGAYAELLTAVKARLKDPAHVYQNEFQGRWYNYTNVGAYKYWYMHPIINRELLPQESTDGESEGA